MSLSDACGAGCGCGACIGVLGGIAGGISTWVLVIWPAMEANPDLTGVGKWLLTFLGPGEAYVGAWAAVGALAMACVLGSCAGAIAHDVDADPEDVSDIELQRLAIQILNESLQNPNSASQIEEVVAELMEKGLLKAEDREIFQDNIRRMMEQQSDKNQNKKNILFSGLRSHVRALFGSGPLAPQPKPASDPEMRHGLGA